MTLETAPDAPDAVIGPAERIHEYLADTVGSLDVLVTVESSGAIQTEIGPRAGEDYPGEWEHEDPSPAPDTTDAAELCQ